MSAVTMGRPSSLGSASTGADTRQEKVCPSCAYANTCVVLAQLKTLEVNRSGLEGEYGWDVFSFIAEAKEEFRNARRNNCAQLDQVRKEAKVLAPEVDFDRVA